MKRLGQNIKLFNLIDDLNCYETRVFFFLNRSEAISIIDKIRVLFGSQDDAALIFKSNYTVFLCRRSLPNLQQLLENDKKYEVEVDEERHIFLSLA